MSSESLLAVFLRRGDFDAKDIFVDLGCRGHDYKGEAKVRMGSRGKKRKKPSLGKWLKKRSAIEPVIGHMKNDGWLGRNHLLGQEGDRMNAILCGAGYTFVEIMRSITK